MAFPPICRIISINYIYMYIVRIIEYYIVIYSNYIYIYIYIYSKKIYIIYIYIYIIYIHIYIYIYIYIYKVLVKSLLGGGSFRRILFHLFFFLLFLDLGYVTSRNQKLNNLLFMDDLKLYAKSERELNSLIQTVRIFSDDVGTVFGLDKCAVLVLKRGKIF